MDASITVNVWNEEISGIIGLVEKKVDSKLRQEVLNVQMMGDKVKYVQAKVLNVDDTVEGFKRGDAVVLRFVNIEMRMDEFGKVNMRCGSVVCLYNSRMEELGKSKGLKAVGA